ncbi:MAG: tetratricopeptide repeat protein [Chloroflexi bacterium]|nr:tetratricopeptide repeat protein [Chloroflexota bacterium]
MSAASRPVQVTEHCRSHVFLEMGWLLVAILVPLWVNLWAQQPFEFSKAALLRTLVWVMVGVWLADCLLNWRSPEHDLRDNPLLWPALTVGATQILATVLAVDRGMSLWGSYERAQGVLTQTSYVLLFLLISARLRTLSQAQRLMGAMVATGIPLLGLGMAQALGWNPMGLISDARSPIYGTLGRANFVGAYLAMLLPPNIALILITRRRWMRLAVAALTLGEVIVVLLTLSRGAWLAAGVAVGAFVLLWFWPRLPRLWRVAALVVGCVALVTVVGGTLWLGRAAGSTAARLTIWRATLALIARRPLLGYGPDTLGLVFPNVYPPQLIYYHGRGVGVDRAHNLFLDWAVTTGLVGLLAQLVLLVVFVLIGWRAVHRAADPERRALLIACLAAVGANIAGNLVSFDITATATATWTLMGLAVVLTRSGRCERRGRVMQQPGLLLRLGMASLVLAGIGMAVVQFNVRPLVADASARMRDLYVTAGDCQRAIAAGERTIRLWPVEPDHHLSLSMVYLRRAQTGDGDPIPWLRQAESELQTARDLRPADYRIWAALGELYGAWGNRWDAAKLTLSGDAYRRATELSPHNAMLYTAWGMMDLEGRRFDLAADRFRQAIDLDATDGYAFARLGDAELVLGRVRQAMDAYRQAVHWEPQSSHAHLGLAQCYWRLGWREAAKLSLMQSLQLDPDNEAAWVLQQQMNTQP